MLRPLAGQEGHPAFWQLGLHAPCARALYSYGVALGRAGRVLALSEVGPPARASADALGEPLGWLSHPLGARRHPAFAPMSGALPRCFAPGLRPHGGCGLRHSGPKPAAAAQDLQTCSPPAPHHQRHGRAGRTARRPGYGPALVFRATPRRRRPGGALAYQRLRGRPVVCVELDDVSRLRAAPTSYTQAELPRLRREGDLVFLRREGQGTTCAASPAP